MAAAAQDFPEFTALHASPLIRVSDYDCRIVRSGPGAEEFSRSASIVLMRHGAFCRHFGRRRVTATVNHAAFFSGGSAYRVSHPADHGDRGTIFNLSPRILNDIIRELDPAIDEHPERPFPFALGPCDNALFWRHRELVRRLEASETETREPLWADVTAIQLVADVLEAAFARQGIARLKRLSTESDHAERVEAAKSYLAANLSERVTLADLARVVNSSPFNFARMFQQQTGVTVHRYLTQLRLRASLEELADSAADITEVALDLGFSSHSHFTETFRREFGRTPSQVRRNEFREMSKNPIVR